MRKSIKRAAGFALAALFAASLTAAGPACAMAAPVYGTIAVTGGGQALPDHGTTFIGKGTDVFVDVKSGVDYYLMSAGYCDVYRDAGSAPLGSYFIQPPGGGAWATTIGVDTASIVHKTPVAPDGRITIPDLAPGQVYEIRVAADPAGPDDTVYGHRFIGAGAGFNAAVGDDGAVVSSYNNAAGTADVSGRFILAVYQGDRLVYAESGAFDAAAGAIGSFAFAKDISGYLAAGYTVKAFCWDKDFAPLAGAVVLN